MSKRFDNKKLLFVFGGLAIILLLTYVLKVPRENATIKGILIKLDTIAVNKIILTPKSRASDAFEFVKENGKWTVRQGSIVANPADGAIQNLFNEILSVKPKSLAAVDKSKWKEFELTDSLATRLRFLNAKGRELVDILVGKFSYKQASDPYDYNRGNNIEGTSFVRVNGEKEVYAVDGFLAIALSGQFSEWRDKSFIRCKKEDVLKVTFSFPGDSSYVLMKKDSFWIAGDLKADPTSVTDYLNALGSINGQDFKDGYVPVSNPVYQINVEGNNLLNLTVKCFPSDGTDDYILNSSLNPDAYFVSKKDGIFNQIFKSRIHFLKK
jgi:hypothetical protein